MENEKYPYSILFAEDEKAIRDNYVSYLKLIFENVYEASNGLEAYKIYKQIRPDILIVDIDMPKMNGIELLSKIRERDLSCKAIMLTAYTDTEFLLKASELKLNRYLVKPIKREELKEALSTCTKELQNYNIEKKDTLYLGQNISWDVKNATLYHFNNTISLSAKERSVFKLLVSNPQKIFTYSDISAHAWAYDKDGSVDAIKTILKKLRKKLPDNCIENIFGVGYKLNI